MEFEKQLGVETTNIPGLLVLDLSVHGDNRGWFKENWRVETTNIPGLLVLDLSVHGDNRGWFKENWQREKMVALGLPDRRWVQNNVSYNVGRGATRGIHAEPWDKFVSVATGSVFGAWVDLRAGSEAFGRVYTCTLDPSKAIYVPRGVGNSYQALEDGTAYTYLVDAHWSAELKGTYDVEPMAPRRTLVTGANGQLGRAVRAAAEARGLTGFDYCDVDEFDFSDPAQYGRYDWPLYGAVINCGAYTAVDKAETPEGRVAAWRANATGPALLSKVCAEHGITLVHVSSDYVFDGAREAHDEGEPLSPLSVYGQSKAAGDLAVSTCPRHYVLRSSWVVGDGRNFVRTMCALSDRVADPGDPLDHVDVVDDQVGRLTFADQMAGGILHLLGYRPGSPLPLEPAPFGAYDLTGSGRAASWAEVAREVFALRNGNGGAVRPVSTADYYAGAAGPVAPRPARSSLDLSKIEAAGFSPRDWEEELAEYVSAL